MSRFNLIVGALFGLTAVLSGAILDKQVKSKLDADLVEKAVPIPAVISPEGVTLRDATSEISILDRRESDERWNLYLSGNRFLMLNGLAMLALGLIGVQPNVKPIVPLLGGVAFAIGGVLYGIGLTTSILFSMPILATLGPVGGIVLVGGWISLVIAGFQANR